MQLDPEAMDPELRRRQARLNILRAVVGFVNLMLWPIYSNVLRPTLTAAGYATFNNAKYVGATLGIITAAAWLHSVRAGVVVQILVLVSVLLAVALV